MVTYEGTTAEWELKGEPDESMHCPRCYRTDHPPIDDSEWDYPDSPRGIVLCRACAAEVDRSKINSVKSFRFQS